MFKRVLNSVKTHAAKLMAALVAVGTLAVASPANAAYAIITETGGEVTFAPGVLVTPIITAVVAAIAASAVLVLIAVGTRWLYRAIKMGK